MTRLLLVTLLLLSAAAETVAEPGPNALCELLWTRPMPPSKVPRTLAPILALEKQGEDAKAAEDLEARMTAIMTRAAEVLRDDRPGVEQARAFMDRYVRDKAPLLAARGDLLVPTLPVATWAAALHCRAGSRDPAVRYLRGAWRDYGRDELRLALFVTFLRFGEVDRAASLAPEEPVGWREKAAGGWFACAAGLPEKGQAFLDQASSLAPDSEIRAAIKALQEACR